MLEMAYVGNQSHKLWQFREMNAELRFEIFNAFNRVNLGIPVLNIASSAFGRIGSTATVEREFQFGVKINF